MTPKSLLLTEKALADIQRRTVYLSQERGTEFALVWSDAILTWLEKVAGSGAQIGTEHPSEKGVRTFGYKRQATILAEFLETELRIIRMYFPGQDWSA